MTRLGFLLVLAACGGSQTSTQPPTGDGDPPGPVRDTRPEIVRRRETACEALRPRMVQCTVENAKRELAAGRITQATFESITAPEILDKQGDNWMEKCNVDLSSRQVRVLEVCHREETECDPLLSCLEHLQPQK